MAFNKKVKKMQQKKITDNLKNRSSHQWDRCHYDFGHYGGKNKEGHHNYKASYYMKK